jgi:hypothetical protein
MHSHQATDAPCNVRCGGYGRIWHPAPPSKRMRLTRQNGLRNKKALLICDREANGKSAGYGATAGPQQQQQQLEPEPVASGTGTSAAAAAAHSTPREHTCAGAWPIGFWR